MKKSTSESNTWLSEPHLLVMESGNAVLFETVAAHTTDIYNDTVGLQVATVPGHSDKKYVKWGHDDQLPYNIIEAIESDEVLSQNKAFNVKTCFGQGIRFTDRATGLESTDDEINDFYDDNSYAELFAGQIYDIKYFYWSLDVLILNRDGTKIVQVVHKPVENVRLAQADDNGVIHEAYFHNFRAEADHTIPAEVIPLLSLNAPWTDLAIRLGHRPDYDGQYRPKEMAGRKFGVLSRIPVPGCRYYPIPHFAALFKGGWLEIKKLIQINLKASLKNTNSVRYHVEIHRMYWQELFKKEGVSGNSEGMKKIQKEKEEEIKKFLSTQEAKGKTWISEYYVDPSGKENRMVRINVVDTTKQGGEWSDDISEACNMLCYADGIHPNVVGAVPGKTQTNNSGSDKREIFTMMQSLEALPQQVIMKPHKTILKFNNWWKTTGVDVPLITLTTLDTHQDAQKQVGRTE